MSNDDSRVYLLVDKDTGKTVQMFFPTGAREEKILYTWTFVSEKRGDRVTIAENIPAYIVDQVLLARSSSDDSQLEWISYDNRNQAEVLLEL